MRIAIDARPASHTQPGGFKRYTEHLIRALVRSEPGANYLVYVDRALAQDFFAPVSNVECAILPTHVPSVGVIWREQVAIARQAKHDHADLVHFPANTSAWRLPCPTIVTLHDIIFWDERPALQDIAPAEKIKRYGMYLYGRWAAKAGIKNARRLITASEHSKREIVRCFGVDPQRCEVVHHGVSQEFQRVADERILECVRDKFDLRKPYILGITSTSPRKNAQGLLGAYRALDPALQERYDLVLVWTHGLWKDQLDSQVQMQGLGARVKFVENVTNADLVGLMNLAATFVFPSFEEGFGLPPLEAMACGTPVIASNRSCLPEILGDAALLVDPADAHAIAKGIQDVLNNCALAQRLVERGYAMAKRYTWERCARETIQVYQEAYRAR